MSQEFHALKFPNKFVTTLPSDGKMDVVEYDPKGDVLKKETFEVGKSRNWDVYHNDHKGKIVSITGTHVTISVTGGNLKSLTHEEFISRAWCPARWWFMQNMRAEKPIEVLPVGLDFGYFIGYFEYNLWRRDKKRSPESVKLLYWMGRHLEYRMPKPSTAELNGVTVQVLPGDRGQVVGYEDFQVNGFTYTKLVIEWKGGARGVHSPWDLTEIVFHWD